MMIVLLIHADRLLEMRQRATATDRRRAMLSRMLLPGRQYFRRDLADRCRLGQFQKYLRSNNPNINEIIM